ncbi:hypothetical protein [Pseudoalteromonas rubra]|uniref:hypothetical protein n=1 Tax=Pseudoalteromonas rubra TaxID=43658 RepID=UPI002DB84B46|nr:hypothetical protein [Pseudoalteromonas rubra]MEC4091868.1 hypothetical protein [Pseudoalteromonas rubra]
MDQENNIQAENILKRYWTNYGGFKKLFKSAYFWSAWILCLILWPSWSQYGWWEGVLAYVPNLLGFSLGGFALWMAIGDDEFRAFLAERDEDDDGEPTIFCDVNTVFVHFLVLQVLAIALALINKAYAGFYLYHLIPWCKELVLGIWFISYFFFTYSITATLAAVFSLYRVTNWYEMFTNDKD